VALVVALWSRRAPSATWTSLFEPRREVTGRIDHLVLPRDDGGQAFLLLGLRHVEVVERAVDLRADLVELFGRDVKVLVGLA
jgi:hypothetical protein